MIRSFESFILPAVNALDAAIVVVLLLNVLVGIVRGAIKELFSLGAVAAGLFAGYRYHSLAASALTGVSPLVAKAIGFGAICIVVVLVVAAIGTILSASLKATPFKSVDRIAGGLFGGVRGFLMVALLLWGVRTLAPQGEQIVQQSQLGRIGVSGVDALTEFYRQQTAGTASS